LLPRPEAAIRIWTLNKNWDLYNIGHVGILGHCPIRKLSDMHLGSCTFHNSWGRPDSHDRFFAIRGRRQSEIADVLILFRIGNNRAGPISCVQELVDMRRMSKRYGDGHRILGKSTEAFWQYQRLNPSLRGISKSGKGEKWLPRCASIIKLSP
jgi:hypothetical protein